MTNLSDGPGSVGCAAAQLSYVNCSAELADSNQGSTHVLAGQ